MNIILSNTDSAPIYEQITQQLSGEDRLRRGYGRAGAAVHAAARQGLRISVIDKARV